MTMSRSMLIILAANLLITLLGLGGHLWLLRSAALSAPPAQGAEQAAGAAQVTAAQYQFHAVDKVIVSVRGERREHYFVLDLVLQADGGVEPRQLERVESIVRNSAVAHLSSITFETLRNMPVNEVQTTLETALRQDLAERNMVVPFDSLLISKMLVQ